MYVYMYVCMYMQSNGGYGMYVSRKLQDGLPNRSTVSQWSSHSPRASLPR